ncbi:4'-phosphopantetheinyl transferase family protein [Streptomyces tendae]|uniref:4'-phosphopantetheinyl transferase family protein n=1 Tax=Streptomyces tendae TaxID=1932 RepID=UPI0037131CF7
MTHCPRYLPRPLTPAAWAGPPGRLLPDGAPRLWLARIPDLRAGLVPLAESLLDDGEKARVAALLRAEDRDAYQVTHTALRLLLGAYLGTAPSDVPLVRRACPVCRARHGPPAVPHTPLHFSVSRSADLCLLAFARTAVGVDVERWPTPKVVADVGESLHPLERAALDACPPARRPAAFARVWTRKEAYLKGLGTGLGRAPHLDHLGISAYGARPVPGWAVSDVAAGVGYAAAVALAERH